MSKMSELDIDRQIAEAHATLSRHTRATYRLISAKHYMLLTTTTPEQAARRRGIASTGVAIGCAY